jgi:hypothetical protein
MNSIEKPRPSRRMINLRKELSYLIHDCDKMPEEDAVRVAIKKMLAVVRYSRKTYYRARWAQ